MSLGIFNRLFNLLEEECQRLDLAMAAKQSGEGLGGASFQRHIAALKQLSHLKEQHEVEQQKANLLTQLATYLSLTVPEPQQNLTVQRLRQEASAAQRGLANMVKIYAGTCSLTIVILLS